MYGLYRAWFSGATGTNYPCLQDTFSPPDTVVRVGNEGEHQFVAHKGVLAAHSGYLKALLANAAAATTTTTTAMTSTSGSSAANSHYDSCTTVAVTATNIAGQSQRQPVTSVSVSSIGGEAFAPLLNYMYTGRLEVTLDNVYSVLLATHLLHMPGALEQCRAALLRLRAPPHLPTPIPIPTSASTTTASSTGTRGGILRPIPSRLIVGPPPLCWPPTTHHLYPPPTAPISVGISHLPQHHLQPTAMLMQPTVPPGIGIVSAPNVREKQDPCTHYSATEVLKSPKSSPTHKRQKLTSRSRTPEIVSSVALPFVAAAAAAFTAFAVTNTTDLSTGASSPSHSISPALSSVSRTHSPVHHNDKSMTTTNRDTQQEREAEILKLSHGQQRRLRTITTSSADDDTSRNCSDKNDNVVITEHDRVHLSRRRARSGTSSNAKESSSSAVFSVVYDIACCDGPVRFHRVLNENYSLATSYGSSGMAQTRPLQRTCGGMVVDDLLTSENDENGGPARRNIAACTTSDSSNDGSNNDGYYTCGYCNHTFKSQYCYRKHAKRHLLPTRINEVDINRPRQDTAARSRREVRLLDLNVQYYPCKICGCKFPSYYFVHKHKKLCHANDEERQSTDLTVRMTAASTNHETDASSTHHDPL